MQNPFKATGKTLTLNTHSAIFGKWPVTQLMDGPLTLFSPKLRCCTMGLKSLYLKKHNNYSSTGMAEQTKALKHSQIMSELAV